MTTTIDHIKNITVNCPWCNAKQSFNTYPKFQPTFYYKCFYCKHQFFLDSNNKCVKLPTDESGKALG